MSFRPASGFLVMGALAVSLASCGGNINGLNGGNGGVHPQNGASAPDGNFPLVLSYQTSNTVTLSANGVAATGNLPVTPVPSPIPTPSATLPPGSGGGAFAVPALTAATTYSVVLTAPPAPPCFPQVIQTIGTFTTR